MKTSASLTALLLLLLTSCGLENKDTALGENDFITIIADSSDFDALSHVMENAFARPLFTPQEERWFRYERYDLGDLLDHKRERNILIVAPLDATNRMGEYMRTALDSSVRALVEAGEQHVFVKQDLWYRGQTVVHLTGRNLGELRDFMAANAQQLEYYFKQAWDEREIKHLWTLPREEQPEDRLMEEHDFSLAVIRGWFVGKDSTDLGAVLLRRQAPQETERWVLLHWVDTENTALLTNEYALETRNRLTDILYRTYDDAAHVEVDTTNYLQFDEVNFQGRYAIRMKGLWRMNDYSMGGPFVSYLFYEEQQKRIYFLDGSVFAPRYEKKKLLQDVDVMMKTFYTRAQQEAAGND